MHRPELLVLTGLPAAGRARVVEAIRALDPGVTVLHHDLRDAGRGLVHRRLRRGHRDERSVRPLDHGCPAATLRRDVHDLLGTAAGRVLLDLDPAADPEQVCWGLAHAPVAGRTATDHADLRGVLAVVDTATWLDQATGEGGFAAAGYARLPGDDRTLAQVAVGQVEMADLVVTTGRPDAWTLARTTAVLDRLAPLAARERADAVADLLLADLPPGARRGRPDDVHVPLLRGEPPLHGDCGVRLVLFSARRPFHPARLHDALDVLLDGVVRSRGRLWLATRPEAVMWLDAAGPGLRIGEAGTWLAAGDPGSWAAATPERRAIAALGWHPRFGDRAQDLTVLVHDADPDEIRARLRGALLTDAELSDGTATWRRLPDPFGPAHRDPCGPPPGRPATRTGHAEEDER